MNSYFSLNNPPATESNPTESTEASTTASSNQTAAAASSGGTANNLWENEPFDNDEFDSDQLDEDESYSWASGITDNQDVCPNFGVGVNCAAGRGSISVNWRDWRSTNINDFIIRPNQFSDSLPGLISNSNRLRGNSTNEQSQVKGSSGGIASLVDICSKYVAANVPFELVECYEQPVPEDLQLKITLQSFPDHIENIRLYSTLANGSVDDYLRGEQLYKNRCVKKVMQIGFHLSAQVVISSPLGVNGNSSNQQESQAFRQPNIGASIGNGSGASSLFASVSIVCDRKRITSCHCTCSKQMVPWCSHIVAVCLFRILETACVEFRPPVSESFSKLKRDQLQKFAQYLISELPQQVLPTAQKLLDKLLKCDDSSMNMMCGAPDPTAGASQNDVSYWCLDEIVLKENVHKTLLKFIVPTPNVVSDIECLEHASSATAAEYTNLLRPLRGREPEGMWNLVSIVREMFRRRDKNSIPLLKLITCECIEIEQILQYWFLVKASQFNSDRSLINTVAIFSNKNYFTSSGSAHSSPVHQACASLMDEIVTLWRIACLDPNITDEKLEYQELLVKWQTQSVERLRKFCNSIINSSGNNWSNMNQQSQSATNLSNGQKLLKRLDMDLFAGFTPALSACSITWTDFDFSSIGLFKQECLRQLSLQLTHVEDEISVGSSKDKQHTSSLSLDSTSPQPTLQQLAPPNSDTSPKDDESKPDWELTKLYSYHFDVDKLKEFNERKKTSETVQKQAPEALDTCMDILFYRVQSLYFHGFVQQACVLAECIAENMLGPMHNQQSLFNKKPISDIPKANNKQKCIVNFNKTVLWRSYLLCTILNDCSIQLGNKQQVTNKKLTEIKQLAFRIGLFGLETPRTPAVYKALEVKLLNQEQDLVNLLKRISIGHNELAFLTDRATRLKEHGSDYNYQQRSLNPNMYQSLPILLASFIFETFFNLMLNNGGLGDVETGQAGSGLLFYQTLGFEAACAVLGMKANVSESAHSILCEGIRRQKGDLALNLLLTYKDDEQSLLKIMDKLLDRDLYELFKPDSVIMLNPFNPNFKKLQQHQLQLFIKATEAPIAQVPNPAPKASSTQPKMTKFKQPAIPTSLQIADVSTTSSTANNKQTYHKQQASNIDSLSSGWEESENESPNLSKDISLLETKYRCLSMTQSQDKGSSCSPEPFKMASNGSSSSSSGNDSKTSTLKKNKPIKRDSGDESDQSSSSSTQSLPVVTSKLPNASPKIDHANKPPESVNDISPKLTPPPLQPEATTSKRATNPPPPIPSTLTSKTHQTTRQSNQPSVALAHFMFEFSKTVLSKAGGTLSTSVYLNHLNQQQGVGGPHRNLHICSFLISLYALGLNNCVQPTWLMRTYSSTVTWINSQAADIGYAAICILIECWQGRLTPSECVTLADRVSRGRDNMTVKAAAELALSGLKYANYMKLTEIQRALIQCKEQNNEMLERACTIVENSVKDDNSSNLLEILFTVAKRWEELFIEQLTTFNSTQQTVEENNSNNFNTDNNMSFRSIQTNQYNSLYQHQQPLGQQIVSQGQLPMVNQSQQNINLPYGTFMNSSIPYQSHQNPLNFNSYYQNQNQQLNSNNFSFNPQMHQMNMYQNQNFHFQQQQQQHIPPVPPVPPLQPQTSIDSTQNDQLPPIKHLISAFRVSMLGLEALPKRIDGSSQIKYRQIPSYSDDVKWLWKLAIKLDGYMKTSSNLEQFCHTSATVIQNPFLLQELAFDTANYLSRGNPSQFTIILCSTMLNVLVQRCLNLYLRCCMSKLHHITASEHEDFINMILTSRNIFYYSGNMNFFSDLIQNVRRSNRCKKDLWTKIYNALNNHNFS